MKIFPYFWSGSEGQLFCLEKHPDNIPVRSVLLISQPFAEEANKSRHMLSLVASKLADLGTATVLIDHYGCGDSEGSLESSSIHLWANDFCSYRDFLVSKYQVPVDILAIRFGALLLFGNDSILSALHRLWLWNPVLNGKQFVNQWFRTRLATQMFAEAKEKLTMADLRAEMQSKGQKEIAGYNLSATWINSIELIDPGEQIKSLCLKQLTVCWHEISSGVKPELTPGVTRYVDQWRQSGLKVSAQNIDDTAFWATQEITIAPLALDKLVSEIQG